MKYPKILVACPTYDGKDYIIDSWVEAIKSIDYPNFEWLIVDNSKGNSYTRKLREKGYRVMHVNRGSNSRDALCNAQNFIKHKVLREGYDYWLSLESDLIPPKDIIWKLLLHSKPVVGCMYYLGSWTDPKIPHPACLFTLDAKEGNMMGTRMLTPKESDKMLNTGLKQIHGVGLGCTLISKEILKKFSFWTDKRFDNKHSDVYFFMDLHNKRIPIYVDTNVVVPHFPSDWANVIDK